MKVITSITADARQSFVLKLDNNESVLVRLYYLASQSSWYFDFEYNGYINNGNKVVLTMNALRHLRNRLPFGIAFLSGTSAEPFQLDDFQNGNVLFALLQIDSYNFK